MLLAATIMAAATGESKEEQVARDVAEKERLARKLREQAEALEAQILSLKTTRSSLGQGDAEAPETAPRPGGGRTWLSMPSVVTWTQGVQRNWTVDSASRQAKKRLRDELLAQLEATRSAMGRVVAVASSKVRMHHVCA
jgi:hypothetical protein